MDPNSCEYREVITAELTSDPKPSLIPPCDSEVPGISVGSCKQTARAKHNQPPFLPSLSTIDEAHALASSSVIAATFDHVLSVRGRCRFLHTMLLLFVNLVSELWAQESGHSGQFLIQGKFDPDATANMVTGSIEWLPALAFPQWQSYTISKH